MTSTSSHTQATSRAKTFRGLVVSNKMKDTIVVLVSRFMPHPKYKKFIAKSKKFHVHDPGNTAAVGDKVTIKETRPISKTKFFVLVK